MNCIAPNAAKYSVEIIDSSQDLQRCAAAWDDLWQRSGATYPCSRAALILHWLRQFGRGQAFRAILVRQGTDLVGALPLVGSQLARIFSIGRLPVNAWSPSGDLLLDESRNAEEIAICLVGALPRLGWPLLRIPTIFGESRRWAAFRSALEARKVPFHLRDRYRIPVIPFSGTWESFRKNWTSSHRNNIARYSRRLEQLGEVRLVQHRDLTAKEVGPLLQSGFAIEDKSWKGEAGSSALRSPGMFDFYRAQAEQLADWGQLHLTFLEVAGRAVAFEYGWMAKQVLHAFKLGYDDEFSSMSPGQVLKSYLLRALIEEKSLVAYDCLGPATHALTRWSDQSYGVSQLMVSTSPIAGRAALHAYAHWWPRWQAWKQRRAERKAQTILSAGPSLPHGTSPCEPCEVTVETGVCSPANCGPSSSISTD